MPTGLPPHPTASQSEGHVASKASGSEVHFNVTPAQHSPRTTTSQVERCILYITPSQSKEEGSDCENDANASSHYHSTKSSRNDDNSSDNVNDK